MSSAVHLDYRPGLTAVKKQVKGKNGKVYERTYYVKAKGATPAPKEHAAPKATVHHTPKPVAAPQVHHAPAEAPKPKTPREQAEEALHRFLNTGSQPKPAPAPAPQKPAPPPKAKATPAPKEPPKPAPAPAPIPPKAKGGLARAAPAGDPSRASYDNAIRAAGGDPAHLDRMMGLSKSEEGWIKNTSTEGGIAMITAASSAYGLDTTSSDNRLRRAVSIANVGNSGPALAKHEKTVAVAKQFGSSPAAVASIRASAAVAQSHYTEDHVTLYRGMKNSRENPDGTHSFATDPLTSFTSDPKVARKFAGGNGRVVAVRVPRSSIVASHLSSPGLDARREREVIVASHGQFTGSQVR